MNTYNDKDLIIPKITITSANNKILIRENSAHVTGSIAVGDYYAYVPSTESSEFQAAYPSLYSAISTAMNDASANTYTFTIGTPTLSSGFTNSGITLNKSGGVNNWGIICTSSAGTFDPRFFGYNQGDAATITTAIIGTDLTGSYSRYGVWLSPKQHSSRLGNTINVQYHNNGNYNIRQTVKWTTNKFRNMRYQWIYANHVSSYRNNRLEYAQAGYQPLAQYDHGNYFNQIWELGSKGGDMLYVYNDGDVDLSVTNHQYEIVSFAREFQDELSSVETRADANGEIYNLEFALWRKGYDSALAEFPDDVENYFKED